MPKKHIEKLRSKPWNPVQVVVITIGLFFFAQFLASLVLLGVSTLLHGGSAGLDQWLKESAFPQFLFVLVADGSIVLGVWYFLRRKKQSFKDIGLAKPRLSDGTHALAAYALYMVIFMVVTVIAKWIAPSLNLDQEQQIGFDANRGIANLIFAGISLVVLPPIVEELLCRGFLYTGLRGKLKVIPSAIITSLVFAAAHLQFGNDAPLLWVAAIDTFVLSLVLVYLKESTGRLAAPMLLHGLKNLVAFSLLFIFI